MSSNELKLLPSGMSFADGNVADNWRRFKQKLDFYLRAQTGANTGNRKKIGLLMTALGDAGLDVYNTFTGITDDSSYEEVIKCFDQYCAPRKNTVYERFVFSKLSQGTDNIDAFVVKLKNQARKCEFHAEELPKLVRDRLVVGIANMKVRAEMLRDPDLTLDKALTLAKAWETSHKEADDMAKLSAAAASTRPEYQLNRLQANNASAARSLCQDCGYNHRVGACPAAEKECNYCHRQGHFASVCRKKASKPSVASVTVSPQPTEAKPIGEPTANPVRSIEVLQLYAIASSSGATAWRTVLRVRNTRIRFKIDSGAECNTILASEYARLSPRPKLYPSSAALRPYGQTELIFPKGETVVDIYYKRRRYWVKVFVVEFPVQRSHNTDNILGLPTIEDVGLVKRTFTIATTPATDQSKPSIFVAFADVFDNKLGDIPGYCTLAIKPNSVPVIEKPRRFAFAMKDKLVTALQGLEKIGVISKVNEPTEWASNLVVVTKPNGSLRICLDPKHLNAALLVPKCAIPRSDDIFAELHDKRYFTVFDLKDGFWQLKLNHESSLLTTFNSPIGRFRWNRLVMGISSAPEIFMNKMNELFGDIPGVYPYFDDLIVTGVDEVDHDKTLLAVLERARNVGIKFNSEKVQFRKTTVNYLGFQINEAGVKPLSKHVTAIQNMPQPVDRTGVLRLLGMTRYLARFIPNLSSQTEALRALTHKNRAFEWGKDHETEFQQIKSHICNATSLRFYRPNEPLFVQTDSSKSGVGCCLYQNAAPIAYASRALTKTEQNYAQIEKELLAVVFALEKFHDYTFGREVTIFSDHRPLVSVVKKAIADLTPRLQRFRLRLLRYNFTLLFQPGKELFVADTLSRAYVADELADESYQLLDVHSCCNVVTSPKKREELVAATAADSDLQKLKIYLRGGWPKSRKKLSPSLAKYKTFASDVHFSDNLAYFRDRLIVPATLVPTMLLALHEGHLNVQKTKRLAKNTLFWIGMSADIELYVASCSECNRFRRNNAPETLKPFPAPTRPWQRLHSDILTFNTINYLVVYDAYSQWIELFSLKSKAMAELISHFTTIFARYGVPAEVVTDNVPYNSAEWLNFADAWNFSVLFSSPRYPQSNGASEKAVAIAKSILQKNVNVHYALLQYRNAPIPHLGYSPAQLLMGRRLRSRVPITDVLLRPCLPNHDEVHQRKLNMQASQKFYHDRGAHNLPPLEPGDKIYYKKDLSDAEWLPGTVVALGENPRAYKVEDEASSTQYLRNRRFIRKPVRFREP